MQVDIIDEYMFTTSNRGEEIMTIDRIEHSRGLQ